jgi:hypothetical protein
MTLSIQRLTQRGHNVQMIMPITQQAASFKDNRNARTSIINNKTNLHDITYFHGGKAHNTHNYTTKLKKNKILTRWLLQ